jgi:alkyl hydroperoxide reductase subunit AhpC
MPLAINETAPDFTADSTEGKLNFYDWAATVGCCSSPIPRISPRSAPPSWAPVAKLKAEFDKRGVKVLGLSVDPVGNHDKWAADILETQGMGPNFPMIGDTDLKVSKLYGMLPADAPGTSEGRTPADNATVRNVFIIGPDKKIKLVLVYP